MNGPAHMWVMFSVVSLVSAYRSFRAYGKNPQVLAALLAMASLAMGLSSVAHVLDNINLVAYEDLVAYGRIFVGVAVFAVAWAIDELVEDLVGVGSVTRWLRRRVEKEYEHVSSSGTE